MDDNNYKFSIIKSRVTAGASNTKNKEVTIGIIVTGIYVPVPESKPYFVPPYVTNLYFGNEQLKAFPKPKLEMKHIVKLDVSNNFVTNIPVFSDITLDLPLSENTLRGPPSWVWKQGLSKLKRLALSGNNKVISTLKEQGKEDYVDYCLDIYRILLVNCSIHKCRDILFTWYGVKEHSLGRGDKMMVFNGWNELNYFPLDGVTGYGARIINLNTCQIHDIHEIITDYSLVAYLGVNYIEFLREEFCYLTDLEMCILSSNKLENLPPSNINMKKLRTLFLSINKIDFLYKKLFNLPKPKCVELYDNRVDTLPKGHEKKEEFDFVQNYASEQYEYTEKRSKLRNEHTSHERNNEKKIKPDDESDRDGIPATTWYAQYIAPLGMESKIIPDVDITSSSSFNDGNVGPQNARKIKPDDESDRDGIPATTWYDILTSDAPEEEFAEQLGFEYVTEEQCDDEDEFVIID